MACQIQELAEHILANYDEKSKIWRDVNAIINSVKFQKTTNESTEYDKSLPKEETKEYDAEFSKELDKKLRVILKKLYPEIRLKYTKTEIGYIDNKSNIKNQKNLVGYNAKFAAEHEFDYFIKKYGKVNSGYGVLSDMSYYDAEDMSNSELKAMQDRARALLEEYREDLEEIGVYSYFAHFWLNDGDSSWDTVNNIPFTFDEYVKNPKNNRLTQGKIYKNFKGEISSHIRKQIQYFIHKVTKLRTKKGIAEKLSKKAEENGYVRLPVKRIVTEHEIDVLNKYSSALKLVGMGNTKRIEDVSIIDREQLIQLFHDSPAVQKLIAIVDSLGVRFITDSSDENIMDFGDTLAYYSPGLTPTVVFPKYSRKRDIIHELIHALLDTKNSKKSDLEEAASLLEQSDKGAELFELFKKSKRENDTEYARKDYREFLAELFSNKAVMDHAKGITTNKDFILNIKALIRNKKMENGNNLLIKLIKETMSENIKEFQGTLLGDMLKLAFDTTKFEYNDDLTLKDRSTQILYQLSNVSENVQRIKGQADIEAKTVLINSLLQSQDTLPHEYAHHYIAWFRDATIVQEAIKKWGSEEALVQAIGEQVVKQKGEAYGWWKKFSHWLKDLFNALNKATKEELVQLLTDSFLERQDLQKEQQQQEVGIIQPSEAFTKNINKMLKC